MKQLNYNPKGTQIILRYKIIHFDEFENSHKILIYPFIVYNKKPCAN